MLSVSKGVHVCTHNQCIVCVQAFVCLRERMLASICVFNK